MTKIKAKICGIKTQEALDACIEYKAAYVGFVFYEPSPRFVTYKQAEQLTRAVPYNIAKVGLFVNPTLRDVQNALDECPLDIIQLHGAESPEFVEELKSEIGLPVMKAVGISTSDDLKTAKTYLNKADMLLFDAKPQAAGDLPGGNGVRFDWYLMQAWKSRTPWMLSGGLNADNVLQAVQESGATQVDISSGVEKIKGEKCPELIKAFLQRCYRDD